MKGRLSPSASHAKGCHPSMIMHHKPTWLSRKARPLGGLLWISVSAFIFEFWVSSFVRLTDRTELVVLGSIIAGIIGRSICSILLNIFRFAAYCGKLLEIQVVLKVGIINRHKCEQITNHLIEQRFGFPSTQRAVEMSERAVTRKRDGDVCI